MSKDNSSKVTPIPNTPFFAVKTIDNQYMVTFGKYAISEKKFDKAELAQEWILEMLDWQVLLNVVGIYVEETINKNKK